MRIVVTGGAGFIGSNLSVALIERGDEVIVIDDLSTGRKEHLEPWAHSDRLQFERCDLLTGGRVLPSLFEGADAVVHLAANADVRFGLEHPRLDLDQNVIVTHNVLEGVRQARVGELVFASTGSVYGDAEVVPTPENAPFPRQTSLYGASKVAAEGFVAAYAEGYGLNATVYRFVSVLGRAYSHGHVIDFVRQLVKDPTTLHILGDGTQRKSYLEVMDCVRAITSRLGQVEGLEVFNLGVDDYCTVDDSAAWICKRLEVDPRRSYSGGSRGWIGDSPFVFLDTAKIRSTGWSPSFTIRQAVERTVDYLVENQWLLTPREPR